MTTSSQVKKITTVQDHLVAVDRAVVISPPPPTLPRGNEPPDPIWYKLGCAHKRYGRFGEEEVFWPLSGTERLSFQPTAEVLHRLSHPGSDDDDDFDDDNHNNNASTNSLFQSECYSLVCTAVSDISRLLYDCC